MDANPDIRRL
jgi:hypothetical protein